MKPAKGTAEVSLEWVLGVTTDSSNRLIPNLPLSTQLTPIKQSITGSPKGLLQHVAAPASLAGMLAAAALFLSPSAETGSEEWLQAAF